MTLVEFAYKVLEASDKPLSYKQIWEKGLEMGLIADYNGTTDPWQTIYSSLNQDITIHEKSRFCKLSKRPVLFGLSNKEYSTEIVEESEEAAEDIVAEKDEELTENGESPGNEEEYSEADLHPVLVKFLAGNSHFQCLTKTIPQQTAAKRKAGLDKWTYPDLIGVRFPYDDLNETTVSAINAFQINAYKIFSFEMKKELRTGNVRECYFQAVSNSSWATEGYLVSPVISEEEEFLRELTLLNNAFGIGVIQLDIKVPAESTILLPAFQRNCVEVNMLNKLIGLSDEVKSIFASIKDSEALKRIVGRDCFDPVLSDESFFEKTKSGIKGLADRKK